ncbi:MAG: ATP-binding cassette domain-containing protein, partial [Thiotrichales bacterium]|nr:ATP-binding cassette domain-containing protein [Thiotrichales bacterium]
MIECKTKIKLEGFTLDAQFSIPDKGITVVFGASGSGKTTLLRAIAGLEKSDKGYLK